MVALNAVPNCTINEGEFQGWKAVYLRNGFVSLAAVPDIGGRIMAYDLGDYPFLFVDPTLSGRLFSPEENLGDGGMASWKNYGGDKTWPSPQGWDNEEQWPGPPDPVLDSGRYKINGMESAGRMVCLTLTSPPDPKTGMQISRRITLHAGSSRVTLDLSFQNISNQERRWSIWDVCQLRADHRLPDGSRDAETSCAVTAPLNPDSKFEKGFWVMFGAEDNPQWTTDRRQGLVQANYRWEIGKIGMDARCPESPDSGWIAFSNPAEGYAFTEQFEVFPGEPYPDDGVTAECWTVGRGKVSGLDYENSGIYLMETEVLSPFYSFHPGEKRSFKIEWGVCRAAGPIIDVQPGGAASRAFTASAEAGQARLQGSFGCFDAGQLLLTWLDETGEAIGSLTLGETDPRQPVELDQMVEHPKAARAVELCVYSLGDETIRRLAHCELEG